MGGSLVPAMSGLSTPNSVFGSLFGRIWHQAEPLIILLASLFVGGLLMYLMMVIVDRKVRRRRWLALLAERVDKYPDIILRESVSIEEVYAEV